MHSYRDSHSLGLNFVFTYANCGMEDKKADYNRVKYWNVICLNKLSREGEWF